MAKTLYLLDGDKRVIFNEDEQEDVLAMIILTKLGQDCYDLFRKIQTDKEILELDKNHLERLIDEYYEKSYNICAELDEIKNSLMLSRINKRSLYLKLTHMKNELMKEL